MYSPFAVLVLALVSVFVSDVGAFGPGGSSIVRRSAPISYKEEMSSEEARPVTRGDGARSMTMMPIGIPKVAYRMPGSRGGEWVDIYQRLTRERIIFMGGEIDDEMANQIIGVLLVRMATTFIPSSPYFRSPSSFSSILLSSLQAGTLTFFFLLILHQL